MGLIARMAAEALHEVEAGGYEWQIRRVSQRDLAAVKHVSLMVLSREALAAPIPRTPEEAAEQAVATARKLAPADVAKLREADVAILRAAVVAAREPGGEWEPIRLVGPDDATDAEAGTLSVRDLPAGVEGFLASEAAAWAAGGAEGVEALRTFRRGSAGGAPTPAPTGEGLRDAPVHAVAGE